MSTVWGSTVGPGSQFKAGVAVSYAAPALGATSTNVTVTLYLYAGWNIVDSTNSWALTIDGSRDASHPYSGSNYSYNGAKTYTITTKTVSVAISQTASTTVSVSGSISSIDYIGATPSVSTSISIPASGVPYAHPTSVSYSSFNFAKGVSANTFVLSASGGTSWSVQSAGTISGITTTATAVSLSGSTINVKLTDAQIDQVLAKWNTAGDSSALTITVVTSITGGTKTWTISIPVTSLTTYLTLSAFKATRGAINGTVTPITYSATLTMKTTSPYYQAGAWPSIANLVRFYRTSTTLDVNGTLGGSGYASRSYTGTSTVNLDQNSENTYYAYLTVAGANSQTQSFTVSAYQSFLAFRKVTANSGYLGINNGAPNAALDVNGDVVINNFKARTLIYWFTATLAQDYVSVKQTQNLFDNCGGRAYWDIMDSNGTNLLNQAGKGIAIGNWPAGAIIEATFNTRWKNVAAGGIAIAFSNGNLAGQGLNADDIKISPLTRMFTNPGNDVVSVTYALPAAWADAHVTPCFNQGAATTYPSAMPTTSGTGILVGGAAGPGTERYTWFTVQVYA